MQEIEHFAFALPDLPNVDEHPSVNRIADSRYNVLVHHRVEAGTDTWHVITRRLLNIEMPEADNAWSFETAVFPEHTLNQPDLAYGRYTRYGTKQAAISGHAHTIERLLQEQTMA